MALILLEFLTHYNRSFVLLIPSIRAHIQDSALQVHVKEVLRGNEVGRSSWEFQGHLLLVGLLLGQSLHIVSHFLVSLEQVIELDFLSSELLVEIDLLICL